MTAARRSEKLLRAVILVAVGATLTLTMNGCIPGEGSILIWAENQTDLEYTLIDEHEGAGSTSYGLPPGMTGWFATELGVNSSVLGVLDSTCRSVASFRVEAPGLAITVASSDRVTGQALETVSPKMTSKNRLDIVDACPAAVPSATP